MRRVDADFLIHSEEPVSWLAILDEIGVKVAHDYDLHVSITVLHPEEIDPEEEDANDPGVRCMTSYSPIAEHKIITEALALCRSSFPEEEKERIKIYEAKLEQLETEMGGPPDELLAELHENAKAPNKELALIDQLTKLLGLPIDSNCDDIINTVKDLQHATKSN